MMRKFFITVVVLCVAAVSVCAEEALMNQVRIGKDSAGMTWFLTEYGTNNAGFYAVARKYYSNAAVRSSTIELLTSRYSVSERRAEDLYFTEYRYEYTSDGLRYAEVYRRFYDSTGHKIMGIEFDGSSTARRKTFVNVVKNTIQSKGLAYASGRLRK